jgi:hypothetical protein
MYVYFRHGLVTNAGTKQKLLCDGAKVADLQNGRFIVLKAAPGTHTINFADKSLSATFTSGKDHYIQAGIEGVFVHFFVRVVDPAVGATEIRDHAMMPNDPDRTYDTSCPAAPAASKGSSER